MKQMVLALVAMMCCTLVGLTVEAAPDDAIKLAKAHYEKGNAAYNLGKFDEAISWFTKAYEAWPMPDFLYNIAQSYRLEKNCRQALFVYKRYLSIKERDKTAPLGQDERAEVEGFIKELSDCAAKADASAAAQPDTLKTTPTNPTAATSTTGTPAPTRAATTNTPAANPTAVTTTTSPVLLDDEREGHGPEASPGVRSSARRLSAYATGGIAMLSAGNLPIPVQPSLALGGRYPLPVGPLVLELGARASFSPIKYGAMNATEQAPLVGVHATLGVAYPVNDKLDLRGDLGVGATMLLGLMQGNPFTRGHEAGAYAMPSFRVGLTVEYALTPNLVATIAPFSFGFSSAPDELVISSLTEIDVLAGLTWRR